MSTHNPQSRLTPLNMILGVLGTLVLLTVVISSARGASSNLNSSFHSQSANVQQLRELDVDAAAGKFTVEFADVTEAVLEVNSTEAENWRLERTGDRLTVKEPGQWFNWCFIGCNVQSAQATLILPKSLDNGSLDTTLSLGSGELNASGNFGALSLEVSAGNMNVTGSATSLTVDLGAGFVGTTLADVQRADLDVSAGKIHGSLTGIAPTEIKAEVSAGDLDLSLPDVPYDVTSEVAAGGVDNLLQQSKSAESKIFVDVSAGNATLRPLPAQ